MSFFCKILESLMKYWPYGLQHSEKMKGGHVLMKLQFDILVSHINQTKSCGRRCLEHGPCVLCSVSRRQ